MQEELIHLINAEQENSLVNSFIKILEKNVGAEYYSNLYLCFTSFESFLKSNQRLRLLIEKNNSHLDDYVEKTNSAKAKLQKFKKSFNSVFDKLFDANYQENLNEQIESLKEEVNEAFELLNETNATLHPVDELEAEIKQLKTELKEYVADINFAYKNLRSLKELKIFNPAVREQCLLEFTSVVGKGGQTTKAFKQLWDLAIVEAKGLNEIANLAKKVVIKNTTGVDELDEKTFAQASDLITKYDEVYSKLTQVAETNLEV